MAAIKPLYKFCIGTNCSKLTITDITGLYNNTTNTQGWSNTQVVGGVEVGEVVRSQIIFTNLDTDDVYTFVLKSTTGVDLYPAEATDEFAFTDFNWTAGDGMYTITNSMIVDSPHTVVAFSDKILVTCAAEACIKNMWKTYYKACACGNNNKELYEQALLAEAMLKGLKAEWLCNKDQKAIKILNTLTKICATANNDCGCS